jgi:hypothetical protein
VKEVSLLGFWIYKETSIGLLILLFLVYLTTLLIAKIVYRRMIRIISE